MNIELDEVVQDVSDDALELAAGGAQGGGNTHFYLFEGLGCQLLLTGNPYPLGYSTLGSDMNIELEEVVVQDVSDDALESAAGKQGGIYSPATGCSPGWQC